MAKTFSQLRKKLDEAVVMYVPPQTKTDSDEKNHSLVMKAIKKSAEVNEPISFTLGDGTKIEIDPANAKAAMVAYEELNQENQTLFEQLIQENFDSYRTMAEFFAGDSKKS